MNTRWIVVPSVMVGLLSLAPLAGPATAAGEGVADAASRPATRPAGVTLYDPSPQHPWNRLHATLFVRRDRAGRTFGADRVDPLLWPATTFLLKGRPHEAALAELDAFLKDNDAARVSDPARRAMLQSDLWALFDWAASPDAPDAPDELAPRRAELEERAAALLRQLRLGGREVAALPDNYSAAVAAKAYPPRFDPERPAEPFLPDDLFRRDGPWVEIGSPGIDPPAPVHVQSVSGRSVFRVLLRLPGGRQATLDYLKRLNEFPKPWALNPDFGHGPGSSPEPLIRNPALPQFPPGTQAALVRQMMVLDDAGRLLPTPVVQGLQLRVYRRIEAAKDLSPGAKDQPQAFVEFRLVRRKLFDGAAGGLRPTAADEMDFQQFLPQGIDPLDMPGDPDGSPERRDLREPAMNCAACHAGPGVHSFNTYTSAFSPQTVRPGNLSDVGPGYAAEMVVRWKRRQYDYGLLQGLQRPAAAYAGRHAGGGETREAGEAGVEYHPRP